MVLLVNVDVRARKAAVFDQVGNGSQIAVPDQVSLASFVILIGTLSSRRAGCTSADFVSAFFEPDYPPPPKTVQL
jgi:hypothetical protein